MFPCHFFQVEVLEELRRARVDDLATLIQKTYRGFSARQKITRLRDSQVVISTYYKVAHDTVRLRVSSDWVYGDN